MVAVLISCAFQMSAQENPGKLTLSLSEAEEFAVSHNRTLMNASIDVQKAHAAKWQAIAGMLPSVALSVDYSNMLKYKMNLGQMQIAMPASATLGITSSIAFNGSLVVASQIAKISEKMADINLNKSERDIRDQVKQLYCSALTVEETVKLLQENLESMRRLYEITKRSVEVGVSEQTDADQIAVQVATMENAVSNAQRSQELVYNSLRMVLCVEENTELILTQTLGSLFSLEYINELLGEDFVLEKNYDYQLLVKSTEVVKKQIAIAGLSYSPTLSVYHQYSSKKYFSDEMTMNMTPPNMIGATLSMPIFNFGKGVSVYKDAKMTYAKQLNTVADTELALRLQHSQLVYNLKSNLEKLETQQESVDLAKRVFDNISKKYENGVASSLEVTNAGTNLINAESNYVQAVLDVVDAQISLEELLNK